MTRMTRMPDRNRKLICPLRCAILLPMRHRHHPQKTLLELVATAQPPPRFPRGYFNHCITPTRVLLDRGFTLAQAIDWMIQQGVVKPDHRSQFAKAMQSRITRLNQKRIKTAQQFSWQESIFFDSSHLVADGEMKAACGSRATSWAPARSESSRCPRCKGAANRHAIVSV